MVYYDDERVRCVLEFWKQRVFLHLLVRRWDTVTLRMIVDGLQVLKRQLADFGYEKLEAYFPLSDPRILHMARLRGMREVRRLDGHILMECDNG